MSNSNNRLKKLAGLVETIDNINKTNLNEDSRYRVNQKVQKLKKIQAEYDSVVSGAMAELKYAHKEMDTIITGLKDPNLDNIDEYSRMLSKAWVYDKNSNMNRLTDLSVTFWHLVDEVLALLT